MKYKLTDETMTTDSGVVLHRIECVNSFSDVKVGEKGGWIEKEENLSQIGNCWVFGNARVFGDAEVYGNARIFDDARVNGNARVYSNARVYNNAEVNGDAWVFGDAELFGDARVNGDALIFGDARVYNNAEVNGDALVLGDAELFGDSEVNGNSLVFGDARVNGNAEVYGDAVIGNSNDYIVFKNNWSSGRYFTWTRSNDMWKVGCFYGTGKELTEKAYKDSKLSGDCYKTYVELVDKLKELKAKRR